MKKILDWLAENILFILTLFLLAFIPLYPKKPLIDINHTWVYIRAEDFMVVLVIGIWVFLLLCKKITFKTPLTMSIVIFWIIGAISTILGILLIFPTLANVFPNVAFLNYLRRIEYLSLFFIAYAGIKDRRFLPYIIAVLTITLFLVAVYGIGQKYLGFPAYLTMNEEFAKGIPIQLSSLSRVSSTFGGHYDLAAYLVLMIPLLSSMIFGFRNLIVKIFLSITVFLGVIVLFMTVSRVSFFVLLLSMILMLILHKKKSAIFAIVSIFIMVFIFLSFSTSLLQRFSNTVKEVDILVDARFGEPIGQIKNVPSKNFKDKIIWKKYAQTRDQISSAINSGGEDPRLATKSALIVPFSILPENIPFILEENIPNGESLPQGTGYVNLTLSPIIQKVGRFYYEIPRKKALTDTGEIIGIEGDFLIKKVKTYDLSFTTRFQGEWPRAIETFKKNILLGGGYSVIGLAVDNNYLRILGEIGLLGFTSYFVIFLIALIYFKKLLPEVDSPVIRSFVLGFIAGLVGLALNAIFIDVFEASKIAFLLWLLMGITLGTLHLYQKNDIDLYGNFKKTLTSTYAIIVYLFITTFVMFSSIFSNYFVGDDFTWLRWTADCSNGVNRLYQCQSAITTILHYFTEANGFFFRPGTKIYFFMMYSGFWLDQTAYHVISILLHFIVTMLLFLLAKKILKNFMLSTLTAFLFIILSGYSEAVFWISSTGFLFNAIFVLLSLLFFIIWSEEKKKIYFILSFTSIIFSLLFHELGVVAPLFIVLYEVVIKGKKLSTEIFKQNYILTLFSPLLPYLVLRYLANSHWLNGDYSYNLFKLPYNIIGNIIGYLMLNLIGPASLPLYQGLRNFSKGHIALAFIISITLMYMIIVIYRKTIGKMEKEEKSIIIFCFLFFIISLLPFLGLGNITSRYSYLSCIGFIMLLAFFLKKIYVYLIPNGRNIALTSVILLICIFVLAQIIQLQKISGDWKIAGDKSRKVLISLNYLYMSYKKGQQMNVYLVNTPIRFGDAWIFPVGLKDASWFVFQNEPVNIYQSPSIEQAFNTTKDSIRDRVFKFNDKDEIIEYKKQPNGKIYYID